MKIKKVFSRQRALECIERDCKYIYPEPNRKNPNLTVFCFEDNQHLREVLTDIQQRENLLKDFNKVINNLGKMVERCNKVD